MKKRVLDIGQCDLDHSNITDMLRQNFQVEIDRAKSHSEAMTLCQENAYDLILVNRIFDFDGSSGLETLEQLCDHDSNGPVMLVSNFADAQSKASTFGAVRGFGKAELDHSQTIDLLEDFLG